MIAHKFRFWQAHQTAHVPGSPPLSWIELGILFALLTALSLAGCAGTGTAGPSGSESTPSPSAPVSVSVSPTSVSLQTGETQQFTATVTGTTTTGVTWSAAGGTISSSGLYTAPNTTGTYTVTATSVADSNRSASATVTVTTAPDPGNTASSITKDGITWTFSVPVPVGQFVTGDYYVVGPVTVTAISPAPTSSAPYRNGSVLNLPSFNDKSGFDDRTGGNRFDASMRDYPPIDLRPGDSLVSSISVDTIGSFPRVMRSMSQTASPVRTVSILTVLDLAVGADALRPSYCDRRQTTYYARNLRRELLPSLPRPVSAPPLSEFEGYFRRPWIDVNQFLFDPPVEYMPDYGREVGFAVSYASLLLTLDFPSQQKELLTNYLVQYGIDLFGCLEAGYLGWPAWGGHGSGRKLPIILAGILLDEPRMKQVSSLYPNKFGEDMQTIYVAETPPAGTFALAWQGATVVYGGHVGINGNSVNPGWGPYEHLQPRDWANTVGEDYRRCCTSNCWVGQALAIRLLRADPFWNHPAFFDYVDRWMSEDDAWAVMEITNQIGKDYSADWLRQRQTRFFLQGAYPYNTFIDDMWQAFR